MLGWLVNMMAQCRASLKKIDQLFGQQPEIQSPESAEGAEGAPDKADSAAEAGAFAPERLTGHVEFHDVSLEMNGTKILQDISFEAKPGSTIAIMGETGSGKSSLIHLIGRYYDCTAGTVSVDGVDVRRYDLQALRKGISVVMQDVFLFSDTIKKNILFEIGRASCRERV